MVQEAIGEWSLKLGICGYYHLRLEKFLTIHQMKNYQKKPTFVTIITNPTTISKVVILAHDGLICMSQIWTKGHFSGIKWVIEMKGTHSKVHNSDFKKVF